MRLRNLRESPAPSAQRTCRAIRPRRSRLPLSRSSKSFLPVMLTEVNGKKAKIRPVDGEEYSVAVGRPVKGARL